MRRLPSASPMDPGRYYDVFVDTQLRPGDTWADAYDRDLRSSDFLIRSPSPPKRRASPAVEEEVAIAISVHQQDRQRRHYSRRLSFRRCVATLPGRGTLFVSQDAFGVGQPIQTASFEKIVETMASGAAAIRRRLSDVGALLAASRGVSPPPYWTRPGM